MSLKKRLSKNTTTLRYRLQRHMYMRKNGDPLTNLSHGNNMWFKQTGRSLVEPMHNRTVIQGKHVYLLHASWFSKPKTLKHALATSRHLAPRIGLSEREGEECRTRREFWRSLRLAFGVSGREHGDAMFIHVSNRGSTGKSRLGGCCSRFE